MIMNIKSINPKTLFWFNICIAGYLISILIEHYKERYKEFCNRRKQHQKMVIESLKEWLNYYRNPDTQQNNSYSPIDCPRFVPRNFKSYVRQHLEEEDPKAIELIDNIIKMYETCVVKRQKLLRSVNKQISHKYKELNNKLSNNINIQYIEEFRNTLIEEIKKQSKIRTVCLQILFGRERRTVHVKV